ncbi:hypothetical protein QF026_000376 [Streptomyces aurantiacus]|uniref:hypothetical protein n=1 Tax=Streptomyces aurantiacus TaxID=47760 RepID=UPI00278FB0BD|nr:hypothetical protein [Streptomyces aurantiacus]MDQ0771910.1 hypothetical protein [Streptomyces aurantiacus]
MSSNDEFADLRSYAGGTFRPSPTTTVQAVRFYNDLQIPVDLVLIKSDGTLSATLHYTVNPGETADHSSGYVKDAWLVMAAGTGALIDVRTVSASPPDAHNPRKDVHIDYVPNSSIINMGPPSASATNPHPSQDQAHTFLVGQGKNPHDRDGAVTRETWWNLDDDQSFTLPANESRSWTRTYSEGVERASTVETEFVTELGLDAKGGWGAITATINASFKATYKQSEQITLTESESYSESRTDTNNTSYDKDFQTWQAMERYTIWKDKGKRADVELSNDTGNMHTSTACYDPDHGGKWVPCGSTH